MTDQQIHLFTSEAGEAQLEVELDRVAVWLDLAPMTELFTETDALSPITFAMPFGKGVVGGKRYAKNAYCRLGR